MMCKKVIFNKEQFILRYKTHDIKLIPVHNVTLILNLLI